MNVNRKNPLARLFCVVFVSLLVLSLLVAPAHHIFKKTPVKKAEGSASSF